MGPRVVVVGAGFGGLWAARALVGRPVRVLLLDRNNYHTFFPLLYQVAAAELVPTDIAYPIRGIFRNAPNVEVRMGEMTGLDLEGRLVLTDGDAIPYDHLVLALGSEPFFFDTPGAERHAFPLRWMDDAIPLRQHVLRRFETATTLENHEERKRLLTFVVVGGGPTGVEFSGALAELILGPFRRDYPGISPAEVSVVLVEAGPRVLSGMDEGLARYAADRLRRRGVEVRLGEAVEAVGSREVTLVGGAVIPTDTVVWTAGVRGEPRAAAWGLPVGRGGRVEVTERLNLATRPEVYVVGDLAHLEAPGGGPYPQVAQVAMQQGQRAAMNILASVMHEEPKPFAYRDYGMLAVIGRNAAVAEVFGRRFRGFAAWVLWLVIHITWLVGFRNRALVMVNWAWNYVWFRRAVRLILPDGNARGGGWRPEAG